MLKTLQRGLGIPRLLLAVAQVDPGLNPLRLYPKGLPIAPCGLPVLAGFAQEIAQKIGRGCMRGAQGERAAERLTGLRGIPHLMAHHAQQQQRVDMVGPLLKQSPAAGARPGKLSALEICDGLLEKLPLGVPHGDTPGLSGDASTEKLAGASPRSWRSLTMQ